MLFEWDGETELLKRWSGEYWIFPPALEGYWDEGIWMEKKAGLWR